MSRWVKATLVKRMTDDGLVEVQDDLPLGREYLVDAESRRTFAMFNTVKKVRHEKEHVLVAEGGWFVTELLEIPE